MENGPFIDNVPIKTSIYKGFSMAMLNNQRVYSIQNQWTKSGKELEPTAGIWWWRCHWMCGRRDFFTGSVDLDLDQDYKRIRTYQFWIYLFFFACISIQGMNHIGGRVYAKTQRWFHNDHIFWPLPGATLSLGDFWIFAGLAMRANSRCGAVWCGQTGRIDEGKWVVTCCYVDVPWISWMDLLTTGITGCNEFSTSFSYLRCFELTYSLDNHGVSLA